MRQQIARRATVLTLVATFGIGALAPVGSAQVGDPSGYPPGNGKQRKKCIKSAKKKNPPGEARNKAIQKCKKAFP
jgi:hypothetical protein